ncbi:transferase [Lithospermum erythrorhizon]|uniref:glutathione transferase n=1 Tax=Lithospermum erythrorhizon TaxID=34254 RepID=A0AAV3RK84_LITER
MAIKVHGSPISTATQRVLATLIEKGVEYELVLVDLSKGEHKHPSFLSLNPFGQVPAFEDGDLKLFESRAITQYIAHTYADKGTPLVTQDPKKMAIQSVWMEVEAQQYDSAASKLIYELVVKPHFYGQSGDEVVVKEFETKLSKVLDVYEARLKESKYLGGDQFSLVDLHHLPSLNYLKNTKAWDMFESRAHVKAWVSEITSRPAWAKVIAPLQK